MSTVKTNSKNGQINRYEFFKGGIHTHEFYDSKTGKSGAHGEYADAESKRWSGHRSDNYTCRGAK